MLDMSYTSDYYYDYKRVDSELGWSFIFLKWQFRTPFHNPDHQSDSLYSDDWKDAIAYGAFEGDKLIGAIETCPEWNRRLRVTEMWGGLAPQKKGRGQRADGARQANRKGRGQTRACAGNAVAQCGRNRVLYLPRLHNDRLRRLLLLQQRHGKRGHKDRNGNKTYLTDEIPKKFLKTFIFPLTLTLRSGLIYSHKVP